MSDLKIIENWDKNEITIRSKTLNINMIMPITEFCKVTAKHIETGINMSDLLKQYDEGKNDL